MDKKQETEVVKIKDAYTKYEKLKESKFSSLSKNNRKVKVTFSMYKQIIKKYLTIYIYDLFFLDREMYFPLSGNAKINKCGNWIRRDRSNKKAYDSNRLKKVDYSLGIFWYNRPSPKSFFFDLRKMTGSSNVIPVIEKEWKQSNDITMLYTHKELIKQGFRTVKQI